MAGEIVEACGELLGTRLPPSPTAAEPLPGGDLGDLPDALAATVTDAARATGDPAVAARLVRAHGTAWRAVWALADPAAGDAALAARLVPDLPYVGAEVVHAVRAEWAATLADVLVRRLPIAYETRDAGRAAARAIAPLVARELGWDDAATRAALAAYDADAARLFAVDP
jgi:glycerol-3-phosphate dehydrogenase